MSEAVVIRCEGVGKRFHRRAADPYHGLREKLNSLVHRRAEDDDGDDWVWGLRDVSFEVKAGRVLGVVGDNGCGKSVLLKVLAQVTKPSEGRMVVNGSIGSILHLGSMLVPELTGRENIYQVGTLLRLRRELITSRFEEIVAFSGIEPHLDSLVRGYSAGMQMRLAFAVFAHLDSDVLLIDEGLSVADQDFRMQCMGRIRQMASMGRTLVIVSHELEMMAEYCDEIALLKHGTLLALGPARDVLSEYQALRAMQAKVRHGE